MGGPLTVTLLKRVGHAIEVNKMSDELVLESIQILNGVARDARFSPVEARKT